MHDTWSSSRMYSIFIHWRRREGFFVERSWMMRVAPCIQAAKKSSWRDLHRSIKCHNLSNATVVSCLASSFFSRRHVPIRSSAVRDTRVQYSHLVHELLLLCAHIRKVAPYA